MAEAVIVSTARAPVGKAHRGFFNLTRGADIETADTVARRHGITREDQNLFSLESQRRMAQAQATDLFDEEIAPMDVTYRATDAQTGESSQAQGRRRGAKRAVVTMCIAGGMWGCRSLWHSELTYGSSFYL